MFNPFLHPICFSNLLRTSPSTWIGHAPFAMFLIDILRPELIVELGTYYGTSYCAFCQAVDELKINAKCYAIDTWQGDSQSGFFSNEVLEDLKKHHDNLYGKFSRLIQSTFEEATVHFDDSSIDLLHIDGFHTYDAVRKDFEMWLPKMSKRGIILFHDINVKEGDFGVWQFWKEVKSEYPNFEFIHSHGLGLLVVGVQCPKSVLEFLSFASENPTQIQNFFYQIGRRFEVILEVKGLRRAIKDIEQGVQQRNNQLISKEKELFTREESIGTLLGLQQALQDKNVELKFKEEQFFEELKFKEEQFSNERTQLQLRVTEAENKLQAGILKTESRLFELQNEKTLIEEQRKRLLTENQLYFAKRLELQRMLSNLNDKNFDSNNLSRLLEDRINEIGVSTQKQVFKFVIGIVTYNNSQEQITKLLKSIELAIENVRELNVQFDVYVIDNGWETSWSSSKVNIAKFDSLGNIGFGKAMNYLMSNAYAIPQTQWFLCHNPDGVLHYEGLNELLKLSKLNSHSLIEARQFPEEHLKDYDIQTLETLWASGACMLIPRDIFEKTKGFDPNFFMYLEDVDLSWRARSAGFSVKIAPNALFGHAVLDRTFDANSEKYFFLSGRYLAYKWKNKQFIEWAEKELICRGHYSAISELPELPYLQNDDYIDTNIADFNYHFHFSPTRW